MDVDGLPFFEIINRLLDRLFCHPVPGDYDSFNQCADQRDLVRTHVSTICLEALQRLPNVRTAAWNAVSQQHAFQKSELLRTFSFHLYLQSADRTRLAHF